MHRRISTLMKPSSSLSASVIDDDTESKVSTIGKPDVLIPPSLKVKRVDYYYSKWFKAWKYRSTSSKITMEPIPVIKSGDNDPWKDYLFVVIRTMPTDEVGEPKFKICIKSEYLLKACKDVIGQWPGVSWNAENLELDPEIILAVLDKFIEYRDKLAAMKAASEMDRYVLSSVDVLLSCIQTDYRNTIKTINNLTAHREITSSLIYSILLPESIFVTDCPITGLPRLVKLISWTKNENTSFYKLFFESVDLVDIPASQSVAVGRVATTITIPPFKGTVPMEVLEAYPLKYHSNPEKLKQTITERGKKWIELIGVYHKDFDGIAARKGATTNHKIKGRIMVDRASFRKFNPGYAFEIRVKNNSSEDEEDESAQDLTNNRRHRPSGDSTEPVELSEEELLLTPSVVYGFSLSDKLWLEFDITKVKDIEWNDEAFSNLVLPPKHKALLQSLVEAHHKDLGFDDFVKGKGQVLVINLFGPPGVGKTFSAEATSEHVRRPLYPVGAADLGTHATKVDDTLTKVLDLANSWKAIVLIDEADVFLERRSVRDLERNAMVAVFLRHIEYYRGIMFLTTNRVKAFDEAFFSRIHIALHFRELTVSAKAQVWAAFIRKLQGPDAGGITDEQIQALAKRNINGREIKNAVRTAKSLATGRNETLNFSHFVDTLDAMEDFTREFESMKEEV